MNSTALRRAAASLSALFIAPSSRASEHRVCQRATRIRHMRPLSTSTRRYQQQVASSPTPKSAPGSTSFTQPSLPPHQATTNAQKVSHDLSPSSESNPLRTLTDGLDDPPAILSEDDSQPDWTRSYHGLSSTPFTPEQAEILQQKIEYDDIEIKPDGIIYLPEIKYRRILNRAFGPGGWGLAPRGETIVTGKIVTREYGLVCGGRYISLHPQKFPIPSNILRRLVSIARGEQQYFDPDGIPTATEGCKSNALMRCCKDLGVASELWDPRFIKKFMKEEGREVLVEHMVTKKRRKHYMRKDDEVRYPFKELQGGFGGGR